MSEKSKELTFKRAQIKSKITRFKKYIETFEVTKENISELRLRTEKIRECWPLFEEVQSELEILDQSSDCEDRSFKEREEFESTYFQLVAKAEAFFLSTNNNSANISDPCSIASFNNKSLAVKLPDISLPTFSGDPKAWASYRDLFLSLIQNNDEISEVQKLYYLRGSLSGEALNIIESLCLTANNYEIAWQLLKERYDNERLAVENHIHALFDLNKLERESAPALRQLYNSLLKHIRALEALNQPVSSWDPLLIHLVSSKFDYATFKDWQGRIPTNKLPKFEDLEKFLNHRCQILESLANNKTIVRGLTNLRLNNNTAKKVSVSHVSEKQSDSLKQRSPIKCPVCPGLHQLYFCKEFLSLSSLKRYDKVKQLKLCFNCLRANHLSSDCKSPGACRVCKAKHNTLIHIYENSTKKDAEISQPAIVSHTKQKSNSVMLSTAVVNIQASNGELIPCRVLLDSGSQINIISEALSQRLHLKHKPCSITISGINSSSSRSLYSVSTNIYSRYQDYSVYLNFIVLPRLTEDIPNSKINTVELKFPDNVALADPYCFQPNKVDMIIGNEVFWDLIKTGKISLTQHDNPVLQETVLGWIVAGKLQDNTASVCHAIQSVYSITSVQDIDNQLQKFWEIDESRDRPVLTGEEAECEHQYLSTVTRTTTGRFVVHLPFKNIDKLGDSKLLATKRYFNLEKKLQTNSSLYQQYKNFIHEYIDLGHMVKVNEDELKNKIAVYLPHHCVIKETSTTTSLRVVFDGSALTSTSLSINDCLMDGGLFQDNLFSICVRFRKNKIAMTADIEKMFRQVLISNDQDVGLFILWRDDPKEDLSIYKLKTVTYGTKCAPWLATRTLLQLAREGATLYPNAAKVLKSDFYMDDLLTGSDDLLEALNIQTELTQLLESGGFHLRKWCCNHKALLDTLPSEDIETKTIHFLDSSDLTIKTLGIFWNTITDNYQYAVHLKPIKIHTKRSILSEIAAIFDPLGLIGPVISKAKLVMQDIWLLKLNWDDILPPEILHKWLSLRDTLSILNQLRIPRYIQGLDHVTNLQIHGFSDASESGYGACIYLRCVDSSNNISVRLICSKARVAPIKRVSLPRLELCAAVLLSELVQQTSNALKMKFDSITFWTDSTVVLSWLSSPITNWNTFVANRVSRIQTISNIENWRHVSGTDNPADIASRGSHADDLIQSRLWWKGPEFLHNTSCWESPAIIKFHSEQDLPEHKRKVTVSVLTYDYSIINKYSCYKKLLHVVAYIIRFKFNCFQSRKNRESNSTVTQDRLVEELTIPELRYALTVCVKLVQREGFLEDYNSLKNNLPLKKKSKLIQLNPFLDEDEVIRVGGRLQKSMLTSDEKHPIVIPSSTNFTTILIRHEHIRLLHAGCQAVINSLRQRFWPLSAKSAVRQVIRKCVTCFRTKPAVSEQLMGQLPRERVTPSRPFLNTGIDYLGPIQYLPYRRRGVRPVKGYIALFVCLSTRALHLELVTDLTSETFIDALSRFTSRRGKCLSIWSDNATTFVGTNNYFKKLLISEKVKNYFVNEGIEFKFIPPKSPHFGGLWEAGVRSVKYHLHRILSNTQLTYAEFCTVLYKIEACLNSRPLTPLSSDPSDYNALTPSHFLIGDLLTAIPEEDVTSIPLNRLSRWQHLRQLTQHFWQRWQRDYISQLQERAKWKQTGINLKEGTLVLIKEDNIPPLQWILGRVIGTYPGSDGHVRVAAVKTSRGTFKRAISKLCPLPIEETASLQGGRDVGSGPG